MINIYCDKKYLPAIEMAANAVLEYFGIPKEDAEAEIGIVPPEEIKALNAENRGIDSVTDVLSFQTIPGIKIPFIKEDYPFDINPETGAVMLGEVYICLERAKEQAEEYGHSLSRELGFLTVHGLLHLLGFDHLTDEGAEVMERSQEVILAAAGLSRESKDESILSPEEEQHTGFVAILGRPNAGKSTLINTLVGEKVSIVSWKPQTTRNKILGVRNEDNYQLIFVDTPGLHVPKNALGEFMMRSVSAAIEGVDAIIYVVDGERGLSAEDKINIEKYAKANEGRVIVALNKIDHITRARVAEILAEINNLKGYSAVVPISALKEKNIAPLIDEIKKHIGVGQKLFPDDMYTDRSISFLVSEIIREKAFRLLDKEVPYGVGVMINQFKENENGVTEIDASVIVQKDAHKPIVLGKNGEMIKKIGTYARQEIELLVGGKVFLTLWVKVKEDWRDNPFVLADIGYGKNDL